MPISGRWCGGGCPATIDGRRCNFQGTVWAPAPGCTALDGGESNDGGGEGYESTGDDACVGFVALGGVIVMCRFEFGCVRE